MSDSLQPSTPAPVMELDEIVKRELRDRHDFNPETVDAVRAIREAGKILPDGAPGEYALAVLTNIIEDGRRALNEWVRDYSAAVKAKTIKDKERGDFLTFYFSCSSKLVDFLGIQARLAAQINARGHRVLSGNVSWSPEESVPSQNVVQIKADGDVTVSIP